MEDKSAQNGNYEAKVEEEEEETQFSPTALISIGISVTEVD